MVADARPTIGYVTSRYPLISHTFVQREVIGLREAGYDIETFSVVQTDADQILSPTDRDEADRTDFIRPAGASKLLQHLVRPTFANLGAVGALLRLAGRGLVGRSAPAVVASLLRRRGDHPLVPRRGQGRPAPARAARERRRQRLLARRRVRAPRRAGAGVVELHDARLHGVPRRRTPRPQREGYCRRSCRLHLRLHQVTADDGHRGGHLGSIRRRALRGGPRTVRPRSARTLG